MLAAITAPSGRWREQRGRLADAAVYADYREMLAEEELMSWTSCSPAVLHHEVATDGPRIGPAPAARKADGVRLADCDDLIALARERGRVLAIGHELRLSSLWGKVKELIDAGAVGEPLYLLIELWRRPYRLGSGGWRYDIERVGNWILEEPIHFFDLARWYLRRLGDPVSGLCPGQRRGRPDQPGVAGQLHGLVTFPGGR